jgi:hypothetical protein
VRYWDGAESTTSGQSSLFSLSKREVKFVRLEKEKKWTVTGTITCYCPCPRGSITPVSNRLSFSLYDQYNSTSSLLDQNTRKNRRLKDAILDAEHVLDEIATEALLSELNAKFQTTASKVWNLSVSAFHNSFVQQIEPKIKEILGRLESLAQQMDLLGLKEGVGGKSSERLPTTSLVEESDICGRNDEREAIIKMLLSDDVSSNEMCVIAIVGMGGIGKTTLAQSVYNNDKVKDHFNIGAWVCVSEEFDVFKVTKTIVEVVTSSISNIKDLNQLQLQLKECLMGKKFLFVLDYVWNETYDHWEALCKPFKYGAQGSKVIVTTRSQGRSHTLAWGSPPPS